MGIALILSAGDKTVNKDDGNMHAFLRCQRGKPNLHWASLPAEHVGRHSDVKRKCEEPAQTSTAYFEDLAHLAHEEPAQTSAAHFEDSAHPAIRKPAQTSSTFFGDFAHLALGNHGIWSRLSLQCFEDLNSVFLCPCPAFNWGVGIYRTEINVCVHQNPRSQRRPGITGQCLLTA